MDLINPVVRGFIPMDGVYPEYCLEQYQGIHAHFKAHINVRTTSATLVQ